jgi:hypothetical protein
MKRESLKNCVMTKKLILLFLLTAILGCNEGTTIEENVQISQEFGDYWFSGKAEVVSYELDQSRYGEVRSGHAVLIFVTEPFSRSRQVKLDNPSEAGEDRVTVMKLNMMKKFITGIYPYSMMLSTFTPVDTDQPPHMLKATMTSQEWCGHVFAQMNRQGASYILKEFSYFESEGDQEKKLPVTYTEDELWSFIRMDPASLPLGEINILPGLFHTRLMHEVMEPEKAVTELREQGADRIYTLTFDSGRSIEWTFANVFPYKIHSWTETIIGPDGKKNETKARFKKQLFIPYWQYNSSGDIILRDSLGIN